MWNAAIHFQILFQKLDYTDLINFCMSFLPWAWKEMTLYLKKEAWVPLLSTQDTFSAPVP